MGAPMNARLVGAAANGILVMNPPRVSISATEAVEFAAWLVSVATVFGWHESPPLDVEKLFAEKLAAIKRGE